MIEKCWLCCSVEYEHVTLEDPLINGVHQPRSHHCHHYFSPPPTLVFIQRRFRSHQPIVWTLVFIQRWYYRPLSSRLYLYSVISDTHRIDSLIWLANVSFVHEYFANYISENNKSAASFFKVDIFHPPTALHFRKTYLLRPNSLLHQHPKRPGPRSGISQTGYTWVLSWKRLSKVLYLQSFRFPPIVFA